LLESLAVTDQPRATIPWVLVAASGLLVALVAYLLFGAYLPTKKRIARLEAELKDVYGREAQLQTRIAKDAEKGSQREQQLSAFTVERDALAKRVDELEKEIAARKPPARPKK
jgi:septal ring factor EnvC (AmiA/AmiB activator)